ncbi:unnamed protein product [Staurois parvus]|uniref:Uncharacterized protein n=1 Tax=Staurois parvus TaxID=386267 RepID=A0ABN9GTI9_9NEOB|nr:unnamed protein product [Staurois parvus]
MVSPPLVGAAGSSLYIGYVQHSDVSTTFTREHLGLRWHLVYTKWIYFGYCLCPLWGDSKQSLSQ